MCSKYLGVRGGTLSEPTASLSSEVEGRPWRESKGQHHLTASRFEVHSRPLLDMEHGADLLWDDDFNSGGTSMSPEFH